MAMDLLQKFFGSNPQQQQDYSDFVQRHQNDPNSVSDEEAARRYREMMRHAPSDLADEANQHGFGQLPEQDRRQLADQFQSANRDPSRPFDGYKYNDPNEAADPRNLGNMTRQAENQDPDLFSSLFGKNSPLNSTLGKAALAGAAAYAASRFLGGQQGQQVGGGAGGLFGGGTPRQNTGAPNQNTGFGTPDLGDQLGGSEKKF